jgi:hypothetical protein
VDLSGVRKTIHFPKDSPLSPALVLFIIWGLVTKFFISLNLRLDSDAVGMGLISMEIGKHHNYLLSGYHLLSSDSLVFTELVPFHLVPQILTNYNPMTLKIMVFFLFVLSVLAAAYLVWFVSGDKLSALLFAALAANIPPEGYFWLAYPTSHNATILFGAAILIIVFSLHRSIDEQNENSQKTRKKKIHETHPLLWSYSLVLVTLVFLSVFSDTIILVWVLIPYGIAYFLFFRSANRLMDGVVASVAITAVIAYILKTYFMPDWIKANYAVNSIPDIIFVNIPLLFKAQLLFLNHGLSALTGGTASIGPAEILSAVFFTGVIFYCVMFAWNQRLNNAPQKRLFYAVLLISVLMMVVSFLVSGYVYDIAGARYLTFTALALLMLVAVSCPFTDKICVFFILSLLVVSAIAGSIHLSTINTSPNEREYDLIGYLKGQNLTYGYGTYWDSNVITYLSGEAITIRSTYIMPDDLMPDLLNSCDRWFTGRPDRFFLIYDSTRPTDEAQKNFPLVVKSANTSRILHYRNYEVLPVTSA